MGDNTEILRRPQQQQVGPPAEDDAVLVERFREGDASAFDWIVGAHQARVARVAYRLLGWSGEVDDVVQEVFVAAWKALPTFRSDARLSTWLTAITVNKCRTWRRRWLVRRALLQPVGKTGPDVATGADVASEAPARDAETFDRIRRAVLALPTRYREVVVLRYLEEMSVADVSRVLGLSRGAVDVRLHRARARLHTTLASLVED